MTFKEKLKQEHPNKIDQCFFGGCFACPYDYGYETNEPNFCKKGENELACTKCWNREIPEEKENMFTKDDLKAGMVVEYRNGHRRLVLPKENGKLFLISDDNYLDVSSLSNDLLYEGSSNLDIVKVYSINSSFPLKSILEKKYGLNIIWERKETKEISVEEACKLLKEKFPEFDKIKILV